MGVPLHDGIRRLRARLAVDHDVARLAPLLAAAAALDAADHDRSLAGVGGILIALVLLVGGFFPRPHAEYPLFSWSRVGSPEREASRIGQGDSPGKGEGRAVRKARAMHKEGSGRGQEGGKSQGQSGKPEGGDGGQKGGGAKSGNDGDKGAGKSGQGRDNPSASDQSPGLPQWFTNGLKWALIVMVGIPITILVMLFVLRRLDSLPAWLQKWVDALISWWQSLFGRQPEPENQPVAEVVENVRPERRFRSFSNPFGDGSAAPIAGRVGPLQFCGT